MPSGSCLCGDVRFEVAVPLAPPDACHCVACRKSSGHVFASSDVPVEALTVRDPQGALRWYASSPKVRRGFCGRCGASLFWAPTGGAKIACSLAHAPPMSSRSRTPRESHARRNSPRR